MITLRGLTKRYGDVLAVDDLTLDVEPGRVTGFRGRGSYGTLYRVEHVGREAAGPFALKLASSPGDLRFEHEARAAAGRLLESAARGADTGPVEEPFDEGGAQIPQHDGRRDLGDSTPTTNRLRPLLSEDRSDEEFEVGLETLLDRLEMVLSQ